MFAELAASRDLLAGDCGLFGREKPGTHLAPYGLSQAEVGTVTGLGVGGAGTTGLAAPDGAFGNRAAPHGLWLSQCCSEMANLGGDIGRSGHIRILQHIMPQDKDRKYAACRDPNYSGLHPEITSGLTALRVIRYTDKLV